MQLELTDDQIHQTLDAEVILSVWNPNECELGEDEWNYDVADVSGIADTIGDFTAANGEPAQTFDLADRLGVAAHAYRWEDVQSSAGKRRGDLTVVDFGDRRAAIFTGQI